MENLSYFGTVNAESKKCYKADGAQTRSASHHPRYLARCERGMLYPLVLIRRSAWRRDADGDKFH
jgi:hypothetical protein